VLCAMLQASFAAIFSGRHPSSPVLKIPSGECNTITNRWCGEGHLTLAHCTVGNEIVKGSVQEYSSRSVQRFC